MPEKKLKDIFYNSSEKVKILISFYNLYHGVEKLNQKALSNHCWKVLLYETKR